MILSSLSLPSIQQESEHSQRIHTYNGRSPKTWIITWGKSCPEKPSNLMQIKTWARNNFYPVNPQRFGGFVTAALISLCFLTEKRKTNIFPKGQSRILWFFFIHRALPGPNYLPKGGIKSLRFSKVSPGNFYGSQFRKGSSMSLWTIELL